MSLQQWTTKEIISAVNPRMNIGSINNIFKRISIDSRLILPGDFFVAINGANYKGINFLNEVFAKGIKGVLIEFKNIKKLNIKKIKQKNITCILVNNTTIALGDLAAFHRNRINAKIIAITGSIGKTTTRKMLTHIFSNKQFIISTSGNMNNQIGLPLTILKIENQHRIVILELGMSKLGEIKRLSEICKPDIGLITNIAPTHLETLKSINNILKAKSEILEYIKPKGSIILNINDPLLRSISGKTQLNVIFFGTKNEANIKAKNIFISNKEINFLLETPSGQTNIKLSLPSKAILENSLAASSAAFLLNCSNKEIKIGLESFENSFGRMKKIKTKITTIDLIDDTYNSSPLSLKRSLETINLLKENRPSIAIIGDMLELGEKSKEMHISAGKFIVKTGINRLYAIGNFAKYIIKGALSANMHIKETYTGNTKDIINNIKNHITINCIILVKGSRGMKMEGIVAKIKKICDNLET